MEKSEIKIPAKKKTHTLSRRNNYYNGAKERSDFLKLMLKIFTSCVIYMYGGRATNTDTFTAFLA